MVLLAAHQAQFAASRDHCEREKPLANRYEAGARATASQETRMRVLELFLAGVLAVTVPIAAHAREPEPANAGPAPGIVLAWDGGGSGRHSGLSASIQRPVTLTGAPLLCSV
jgi:hypothetical protein